MMMMMFAEKVNNNDLILKMFFQCIFEARFEASLKLANISREKVIFHDGYEVYTARFLSF